MVQKSLMFMRFHGVFLGNQHEIWSKQHNGKVRVLPPTSSGSQLRHQSCGRAAGDKREANVLCRESSWPKRGTGCGRLYSSVSSLLAQDALMITGTVEQYVDISVHHTIFFICSMYRACGLQGSDNFTAQFVG